MAGQQYAMMARKHWQMWLPEKVAALKAVGTLEQALQTAGKLAFNRVVELMEQGYQQHEAEEVALAEFVMLQPEIGAEMEPWELEEEAMLEARYRKMKMGE